MKAEKRLKRLQGPGFVSHRTAQYTKMSGQLLSTVDKLRSLEVGVKEVIVAGTQQGSLDSSDKALQAYLDTANLALKWCSMWISSRTKKTETDGSEIEVDLTSADFRSAVDAAPVVCKPVASSVHLRTRADLQALLELTLTHESVEPLDRHQALFKQCANTMAEFTKFIQKAATDLKGYINQKAANADKTKEKAKKDAEKKAVEATKESAKRAAQEIKKQAATLVVPALFSANPGDVDFKSVRTVEFFAAILSASESIKVSASTNEG